MKTTAIWFPSMAFHGPLSHAPDRWWGGFLLRLAAWRKAARRRAVLRALADLSPATLRDIGLDGQVPQRPALTLHDYARGHW